MKKVLIYNNKKNCSKCAVLKSISEFHNDSKMALGLHSNCKVCVNKANALYRQKNKVILAKQAKKYRDLYPETRKTYYENNKRKILNQINARQILSRKTLEGKLKYNARMTVHYNLRVGNIKKKLCEICKTVQVQAHHYLGYAKENQLKIKWLCSKHHGIEHRK